MPTDLLFNYYNEIQSNPNKAEVNKKYGITKESIEFNNFISEVLTENQLLRDSVEKLKIINKTYIRQINKNESEFYRIYKSDIRPYVSYIIITLIIFSLYFPIKKRFIPFTRIQFTRIKGYKTTTNKLLSIYIIYLVLAAYLWADNGLSKAEIDTQLIFGLNALLPLFLFYIVKIWNKK